jgi:glycosyltransferase involved in cell wall biosynthesis
MKLQKNNPNGATPILSIGLPVFNQERIIRRNINSILSHTFSFYELIIIDDASKDATLEVILSIFDDEIFQNFPNLTGIKVYSNRKSRFETNCDDYLIQTSQSNLFLEIQSDMLIEQPGYDQRLIEAIESQPDLIAISGRGVHRIAEVLSEYAKTAGSDRSRGRTIPRHVVNVIRTRVHEIKQKNSSPYVFSSPTETSISDRPTFALQDDFLVTGETGQLGVLMEKKIEQKYLEERKIFIGETVMRGPLLIDKEKLAEIGNWDYGAFFQAYDDHDFCLKAYLLRGFRVGYVPIGFASPASDGTTRKKKSLLSEFAILSNLIRIHRTRRKSYLFHAAIFRPPKLPEPKIRNF